MTDVPFPADTIRNHRFHVAAQGVFVTDDGIIRLQAQSGLLRLYPRHGKTGKRLFRAAY